MPSLSLPAWRFVVLWAVLMTVLVVVFLVKNQEPPRAAAVVPVLSRLDCASVQGSQRERIVGRIVLRDLQIGDAISPQDDLAPAEIADTARVVTVRAAVGLNSINPGDVLGIVPIGSPVPAQSSAASPTGTPLPETASTLVHTVVLRVGVQGSDGLVPLLIAVPDEANNFAVMQRALAGGSLPPVSLYAEVRRPDTTATPQPRAGCPTPAPARPAS